MFLATNDKIRTMLKTSLAQIEGIRHVYSRAYVIRISFDRL
jgi:hypothetical protein